MTIYYECPTCEKEIVDEELENIPTTVPCPYCGEVIVLFTMTAEDADNVIEFLQFLHGRE